MTYKSLAAGFLVAMAVTAGSASAASFSLNPFETSVEIGDSFSVTLSTDETFPEVFGVEGNLTFDESLLSFNSISYNPAFDIVAQDQLDGPGDLFVSGGIFADLNTIEGAFDVATISFTALAVGMSSLSFAGEGLIDVTTVAFSGDAGARVTITDASEPEVIPLPAGAVLLLTGLFGLAAVKRRKAGA